MENFRFFSLCCFVFFLSAFFITSVNAASLRFYGNGVSDIDRVKIRVNPQVPADVGLGNFTIEFWMKALPGEYIPQRSEGGGATGAACAPNGESWINGDIILDRSLWQNLSFGDFGLSMFPSGLAFGMFKGSPAGEGGICGNMPVNDGVWHHIAITRNGSTGAIALYVDGARDSLGSGPTGNISYNDTRGLSSSPPAPPGVATFEPFLIVGAEKYGLGDRYPSFSGWLDELRLSNSVRYTGTSFVPPTQPFVADAETLALYHFDEGSGDAVGDAIGRSPGTRSFGTGGRRPAGPEWSADSPFAGTSEPPPPPPPPPPPTCQ